MNELQVFASDEFGAVRTFEENGKILFCGKDITTALGYTDTVNAIKQHCRGVAIYHPIKDKLGRQQTARFISESDVYRLITHSKLSDAVKFESWVFDEVLPSIRRHGLYATEELIADPDLAIAAFTALKEEREKRKNLETQVAIQSQQIGELKPKADYYDEILKNKGLVTITQIAKDYGLSGSTMNRKLHELGVQFKQSGQWLLYSKYHDKGYTHSETVEFEHTDGRSDVKMNTKWTQKGRFFLYELLKKNGILPLIEKA